MADEWVDELWGTQATTATASDASWVDDLWGDSRATATIEPPPALGMGDVRAKDQLDYESDVIAQHQQDLDQSAADQAALNRYHERSPIRNTLPVRVAETLFENVGGGGAGTVATGLGYAADVVGAEGTAEYFRGKARQIYGTMARRAGDAALVDELTPGDLPFSGAIRQGIASLGESALVIGATGGMGAGWQAVAPLAGYFAAKQGAETLSETGSMPQAFTSALIEGGWTMAGGALGGGIGRLAGVSPGVLGRAAGHLATKVKLPAWSGEALSGATVEAMQEAGTEASHYLAEVGFGRSKWDRDELARRMKAAAGPALVAGGLGGGFAAYVDSTVDALDQRVQVAESELPKVAEAYETADRMFGEKPELAEKLAEVEEPPSRRKFAEITGEAKSDATFREVAVEEAKRRVEESQQPEPQPEPFTLDPTPEPPPPALVGENVPTRQPDLIPDMKRDSLPGQQDFLDQPEAPPEAVAPPPEVVEPPAPEPAPVDPDLDFNPDALEQEPSAGERFRQQVEATATSPDEAIGIVALAEANAAYKGQTLDEWAGENIAEVKRADISESKYVKNQGIDAKTLATGNQKGRKVRGETQFDKEDGRAIIRAFKGSQNAAVLAHELGHVFRRTLLPEDLAIAEKAIGVKKKGWQREHEEKFARWFERYLRDGYAPTTKLKEVFSKFKDWLTTIYKNIAKTPLAEEVPAPLRDVFARMLGAEQGDVRNQIADLKREGFATAKDAKGKRKVTERWVVNQDLQDRLEEHAANDPSLVAMVIAEGKHRAAVENERRASLRQQFGEVFMWNKSGQAMRAKRALNQGKDEEAVKNFDLIGDMLSEDGKYAELAAEVAKFGYGDINSGILEAQSLGAKQFDPVPVDDFIQQALDEVFAQESSEGRSTGVKHASTEAERAIYGLPPRTPAESRADEDVMQAARREYAADPLVIKNLIDDLQATPNATLSLRETALMAIAQREAINEYDRISGEIQDAIDRGDNAAAEGMRGSERAILAELEQVLAINERVGSEEGAAFRARQWMVNPDTSLAGIIKQIRAAEGGRKLTSDELKYAAEQAREIEQLKADLAKMEKLAAEKQSKRAHQQLLGDVAARQDEADAKIAKLSAEVERHNKLLQKQADLEAAVKRRNDAGAALFNKLKNLGTASSTGFDPEILSLAAQFVKASLEVGIRRFDLFIVDAAEQYGKDNVLKIGKELEQAWNESATEVKGTKPATDVSELLNGKPKQDKGKKQRGARKQKDSEGGEEQDLNNLAQELAKEFISDGVRGRHDVIDAVHQALINDYGMKDLTWRQAMDAISDYGKVKQLNPDPEAVLLRQYKSESRDVAKLLDMMAGKPPKATGIRYDPPHQEKRDLTKLVNEYKKRYKINVTDPAKQLQSALGAVKTRLRNQIADLNAQIKKREKAIKVKTLLPYDAEANALKAQRDALRQQFDTIFGKPGMTDQQRIDMAVKATERSIAEYERRIKEGDFKHLGNFPPKSPKIDVAKARLKALKSQYEELKSHDVMSNVQKQRLADMALQRRIDDRIVRIEERIAKKDFDPKQKKERWISPQTRWMQMKLDAAMEKLNDGLWERRKRRKLQEESDLLDEVLRTGKAPAKKEPRKQRDLPADLERKEFENKRKRQKVEARLKKEEPKTAFRKAVDWLNIPVVMNTMLDLSAVGVQNTFSTAAHPIAATKFVKRSVEAFLHPGTEEQIQKELDDRVLAPLWDKAGMVRTDPSGVISSREEGMASYLADRIPGARRSSVAFSTYSNLMRDHVATIMNQSVTGGGVPTLDQAKGIAHAANTFTGRGSIGNYDKSNDLLQLVLWSPRMIMARFGTVIGQPGYTSTPGIRLAVAKEYGRFLASAAVVYGLVGLTADEWEKDPRSSNFMAFRYGSQWYNPFSGLASTFAFMTQTLGGQIKERKTGKIRNRHAGVLTGARWAYNLGKKPLTDTNPVTEPDPIWSFARNKLAPWPGQLANIYYKKNPIGEPTTPWTVGRDMVSPFSLRSIKEQMSELGMPQNVITVMTNILGWKTFGAGHWKGDKWIREHVDD